ncbi:ammonium transporter [Rhabdothermincola salaria]|uniref:ammonium transporter n=1 Tax=Rhabdothermincola salaria TaxID=2903142 RepID=UPI001E2843D6|nr:ammonium transporter [Rhabdothermincola salaria]MCD9624542.1 ammonium transporter [Rhabdothermincola salaria]
MRRKLLTGGGLVAALLVLAAVPALAQEGSGPDVVVVEAELLDRFTGTAQDVAQTVILDNIFIFISGVLVFFMQLGFALLASGLTRAKNSANMMMKSLMDAALGVLVFALVGWGLAYPGFDGGGFIGFAGWGVPGLMDLSPDLSALGDGFYPLSVSTDFFFQAAFAATAATIVAGAVAERTRFVAYIVYTIAITGFIYPVVVSWQWGGGWLAERGFMDFAGSGLVHMTGGVAAFMGALILGPRLGKFGPDGKPRAIPAHSIPLALTGVLILFIGWFGFNPGSALQADMSVPIVAVLTLFAACAGAVGAMISAWLLLKKPDVSMAGNGLLAGLVSICAIVGNVNPVPAIIVGFVAGLVVVPAALFIERVLKVDDPVGAVAVHAVSGFWGLTAAGLFAIEDGLFDGGGASLLGTQLLGALGILAWVAVTTGILFGVLKAAGIFRVSPAEEIEGLDLSEHGSPGYAPDSLAGMSEDMLVGSAKS